MPISAAVTLNAIFKEKCCFKSQIELSRNTYYMRLILETTQLAE